jgi:hypothetical protein
LFHLPKFKTVGATGISLAVLALATGCGGGSVRAQFTLTMASASCTSASLSGVVTNASNVPITVNPQPPIHLDGRTFTVGGFEACSPGTSVAPGSSGVVVAQPALTSSSSVKVFPGRSARVHTLYGIPASLCGTQGWLTEPAFGRVAITFRCTDGG